MNLSQMLRNYLSEQARIAAQHMESEEGQSNIEYALFYYTAVYGATMRVLNIQFDSQLLLLHWIFEHSYIAINNRLTALRQGAAAPITIGPRVIPALAEAVGEFALRIRTGNDDYTDILEKITAAAYVTAGNGYYLMDTGVIKL